MEVKTTQIYERLSSNFKMFYNIVQQEGLVKKETVPELVKAFVLDFNSNKEFYDFFFYCYFARLSDRFKKVINGSLTWSYLCLFSADYDENKEFYLENSPLKKLKEKERFELINDLIIYQDNLLDRRMKDCLESGDC